MARVVEDACVDSVLLPQTMCF